MSLNIDKLNGIKDITGVFDELKNQVGWNLKIRIEDFHGKDSKPRDRRIILHSRKVNKLSKLYNGLVLEHTKEGAIRTLCYPIPKLIECKSAPKSGEHLTTPVSDGTTCNLYHYGDEWCISTNGHYDATQYTWFGTNTMIKNLEECVETSINEAFNTENTYLINFSHPDCHFHKSVDKPRYNIIAINGNLNESAFNGLPSSDLGKIYRDKDGISRIVLTPEMRKLRRLVYHIPKNMQIAREDRVPFIALRAVLMGQTNDIVELAPKFEPLCIKYEGILKIISTHIYSTMRNSKERKKLLDHANDTEHNRKKAAGIILRQIIADNGKALVAGRHSVNIVRDYVYDVSRIELYLNLE